MTNDQQPAESNDLQEREARFDYGFRMKCDCGELSDLSAAGYIERESLDARIACSHCGTSIHYGRAVAGIRDRHDPALDNSAVARFAWYHSSTSPDWPSPDYTSRFAARVREAELRLGHRYGTHIELAKALHVGTYEAAVENMLRRMRDQDDATSSFYLYRVSLGISAGRINDGYREENNEPASQISLDELQALGLDALRYLKERFVLAGVFGNAVLPWMIAGCWFTWKRWGRSPTGARRFGCARRWVPLRRSGAAIRREWAANIMWSGPLKRTWPGAATLDRPLHLHPGWMRRKAVGSSFGGGWA
ncbi:hypothetical protein OG471_41340 [Streptomyces sp. NBC_01336]|uniref:hypothetical protein n=1 Tax=Streptomyces sp. NBC_01336 TaxID=2903829 RepID=UPI002E1563F3|nr:hypothetical protein OG471_00020 [Streptomyces sp. NBC_01336]WSI68082.1 hypothetical protein OG471_41340 [Streptomyces sp. NBC_01336]